MDEFLKPNATFLRLVKDWKKYGTLSIGFDFDQTVCPFHDPTATYDMVIRLLRELKEIGCTLVCWTANPNHEYVKEYCEKMKIPCDGINIDTIDLGWASRKPFYSALLCDRAGLESVYRDLCLLVWYVKEHHLVPEKEGKQWP